jgi:hypothetical protein
MIRAAAWWGNTRDGITARAYGTSRGAARHLHRVALDALAKLLLAWLAPAAGTTLA